MSVLDPSTFVRLRAPRPVNRYAFVRDLCVGKRVLDLGAYDETEVGKPRGRPCGGSRRGLIRPVWTVVRLVAAAGAPCADGGGVLAGRAP